MSKNWTLCPVIGNHSIPLNRHHLNTGLVCYSSFCCIWGPTYSFVHRHAMLVRQIFFSPFYYFNFYETNLHPQMSNVLLLFWLEIFLRVDQDLSIDLQNDFQPQEAATIWMWCQVWNTWPRFNSSDMSGWKNLHKCHGFGQPNALAQRWSVVPTYELVSLTFNFNKARLELLK